MDVVTLKNLLGIDEDDEDYDVQIDAALNFYAGRFDNIKDEVRREDMYFYSAACMLERIAPELMARVSSYSVGEVSESLTALPEGLSFCGMFERLQHDISGFGIKSGARSGCGDLGL